MSNYGKYLFMVTFREFTEPCSTRTFWLPKFKKKPSPQAVSVT